MTPTGTHFNFHLICHRKMWLFANGINMELIKDSVTEKNSATASDGIQNSVFEDEITIGNERGSTDIFL